MKVPKSSRANQAGWMELGGGALIPCCLGPCAVQGAEINMNLTDMIQTHAGLLKLLGEDRWATQPPRKVQNGQLG